MADETAPDYQDTPVQPEGDSQEGAPAESSDNWQQRYLDAQSWGTQNAQEAAELREIIELARTGDSDALEYMGWQVADDEDESDDDITDEYDFESDEDQRIARLEEVIASQLEDQAQAAEQAEIEELIDMSLHNQLGVIEQEYGQLTDDDASFLIQVALANPDEDGLPDLIGAYAADADRLEAKRQEWFASKMAPQALSGASPSSQPDLDNKEERREYIAQRLLQNQLGL